MLCLLHFNKDFQLKPIQQGNMSLMSEFICFGDLSSTDLVSLNIMRMHKKVINKSDIVLFNGKTIKEKMLTGSPGHSDSHNFPTQCPTPDVLAIRNTTVRRLSLAFLVLTVKLQEYIGPPHSSPLWLLDNLGTTLHHNMVWEKNCTMRSITIFGHVCLQDPVWTSIRLETCLWTFRFLRMCKRDPITRRTGLPSLLDSLLWACTTYFWVQTCD